MKHLDGIRGSMHWYNVSHESGRMCVCMLFTFYFFIIVKRNSINNVACNLFISKESEWKTRRDKLRAKKLKMKQIKWEHTNNATVRANSLWVPATHCNVPAHKDSFLLNLLCCVHCDACVVLWLFSVEWTNNNNNFEKSNFLLSKALSCSLSKYVELRVTHSWMMTQTNRSFVTCALTAHKAF